MSARWEKFWVAFIATIALSAFCFGVVVIFIWLLTQYSPFIAFPVVFLFGAIFAGVMHASSDDGGSR